MRTSEQLYESIGQGYARQRRPDSRIAAAIQRALGDAESVVNVGAGTGSYEPAGRRVVAVEPSRTMIAQRKPDAAPAVCASAEALPLRDLCCDVALAILTLHHWSDLDRGLAEMRRVSRERVVIVSWDPEAEEFWLGQYFPELIAIDREIFPTLEQLGSALGSVRAETLPIPGDCCDGFLGAYWRRPDAYLQASTRRSISTFSKLRRPERGLRALSDDLDSGRWDREHGELRSREALDVGYRILVSPRPGAAA